MPETRHSTGARARSAAYPPTDLTRRSWRLRRAAPNACGASRRVWTTGGDATPGSRAVHAGSASGGDDDAMLSDGVDPARLENLALFSDLSAEERAQVAQWLREVS